MKNDTIVIYESDNELSKSLALVLEDDFTIIEVSTFAEAVENAIDHQVNTLILDLNPNEMDKREELAEIRRRSPDTKIILLYVYSKSAEESDYSTKDVSDAVLYKPLDINHFIKTVQRVNNLAI